MQEEYATQFEEEIVCAKHFTVVIHKLPDTFRQYKDESSIMFALWNQINNKIEKCKKAGIISNNFDSTILDINFGLSDYKIFN